MFDVDFEPDIVIGPVVIDFLSDFFTRHNSSLDALITILHVSPTHQSKVVDTERPTTARAPQTLRRPAHTPRLPKHPDTRPPPLQPLNTRTDNHSHLPLPGPPPNPRLFPAHSARTPLPNTPCLLPCPHRPLPPRRRRLRARRVQIQDA